MFIILAHRWGDTENHTYLVGIAKTRKRSVDLLEKHEIYRGGKYACSIWQCHLGKIPKQIQKPWQRQGAKTVAQQMIDHLNTEKENSTLRKTVAELKLALHNQPSSLKKSRNPTKKTPVKK